MDQDLVIKAQHGDQTAFRALALASHARLFRVAQGIVRDPHTAEDATQQAMLDIWRHIRRLRDPSRFEGWSYRLVVHACYAEAKRRPRWVDDSHVPAGLEPRTVDEYSTIAHRDELERAFRRLSLDHRAVVVLHHLLDMPLEQIAETLEIRVGTVKSRLHRAMQALRSSVEADARLPERQPTQEVVR